MSDAKSCTICKCMISDNIGLLECKHKFDFECIHQWSKISNTCPICRIKFNKIHNINTIKTFIKVKDIKQNNNNSYDEYDPLEFVSCNICGKSDNEHLLLLCDTHLCNNSTHTYCIGLINVPNGEWFCNKCQPTKNVKKKLKSNQYICKGKIKIKTHKCNICNKLCNNEIQLKEHMYTHRYVTENHPINFVEKKTCI